MVSVISPALGFILTCGPASYKSQYAILRASVPSVLDSPGTALMFRRPCCKDKMFRLIFLTPATLAMPMLRADAIKM